MEPATSIVRSFVSQLSLFSSSRSLRTELLGETAQAGELPVAATSEGLAGVLIPLGELWM